MRARILLLAGLTLAGGAYGGNNAAVTVRWRSQRLAPADLAETVMPAAARAAVARIEAHAAAHGQRIDVSRDGRVVLVSDGGERTVHGPAAAVREALEGFDALFPHAGPGRTVTVLRAGPTPEDGVLQRDGTWRSDDADVWRTPATESRRAAEGRLARTVARALLRDRYGELPGWFVQGVELILEARATGRFASEHASATPRSWRVVLRRTWRAQEDGRSLDLAVLGWRPLEDPEYRPGDAATTWGLVGELAAATGTRGLGDLAAALSGRVEESSRAPGAGAGPEAQTRLVERVAGEDALARLETALASGRVALPLH